MINLSPELVPLWNKIVKKNYKLDTINPATDTGHSLQIGNPGSGKTSSIKRIIETLMEKGGSKVLVLNDGGRGDFNYMMFPSISPFWAKPKVQGHKIVGARGYKVMFLKPISRNMPTKVTYNTIPFTIGVDSLSAEDIAALVGGGNIDSVKSAFYSMQPYVTKNTTPRDYLSILGSSLVKSKDLDRIKLNSWAAKRLKGDALNPLVNEGVLTAGSCDITLNLREILKDKKTIHILMLKDFPQNLWSFLIFYFMNHCFKILGGFDGEKKLNQKTTIAMSEVADLLDNTSEMGSSAESISKMIGKILKQSRTTNMFLLMDTQIPQQLPDVKDTMQRIYVFNSGISEIQKAMEIIGISTRSGEITQDDLNIIPRLPRGYYYLFDKNYGVSFHKLVYTRSRTYEDGEDFYSIYDRLCGKASYVNISHILEKLKKEREDSEKIWKLKANVEKEKTAVRSRGRPKVYSDEKMEENDDEIEDEFDEEDAEVKIRRKVIPTKKKEGITRIKYEKQEIEIPEKKLEEKPKKNEDIPMINGSEEPMKIEEPKKEELKKEEPKPPVQQYWRPKPRTTPRKKINYAALAKLGNYRF